MTTWERRTLVTILALLLAVGFVANDRLWPWGTLVGVGLLAFCLWAGRQFEERHRAVEDRRHEESP